MNEENARDVLTMEQPKYRRVLLKISGEALAGDASRGLDFSVIGQVCDVIKRCVEQGVQVERQKAQRVGVVALGQQHEDVHRHVAGDDDAHQVGNAETGMRRAEPLHPIIQFFQGEGPPVVTWYKEIVPSIAHKRPKVMSFF